MTDCLDKLRKLKEYTPLRTAVLGDLSCAVFGVDMQKPYFTSLLQQDTDKTFFIIVPDEKTARSVCEITESETGKAFVFPVRDYSFRNLESSSRFDENRRMETLSHIKKGDFKTVIIPAEALCSLTVSPEDCREVTLYASSSASLDDLQKTLVGFGYENAPQLAGPGQFSCRGGILDIFPPSDDAPTRLEFFGDEIDSLYHFDINTQRRTEPVDLVRIIPAVDYDGDYADRLRTALDPFAGNDFVRKDLYLLDTGILPRHDRYLPLRYRKPSCILDYIPDNSTVFIFDHDACFQSIEGYTKRLEEDIKSCSEDGAVFLKDKYFFTKDEIVDRIKNPIIMDTLPCSVHEFKLDRLLEIKMFPTSITSTEMLAEEITGLLAEGYDISVLTLSKAHEQDLKAALGSRRNLTVCQGSLPYGFTLPDCRQAVYSFRQKASSELPKRKTRYARGERIKNFSDISQGDYVVHQDHGICIYDGIHKVESLGVINDYIRLKFAGTDVMYIPCSQLDLISKYTGAGDDTPVRLNKLGSAEWEKTKQRVKRAVRDLAKQLIALYGERMKLRGFAYSPDTEWQRDFEAGFPFTETEDQLKSIYEIKQDMERPVPMDRLLCGDVGYGKTEVALRAIFKAVMDGKQVALLAPTTLLAFQHFNTMQERYNGFPIRVEILTRMKTPQQQKNILKRLKEGNIDVLVGTHKILQKNVAFKDLGLIVIDEEQRFGVEQKEHLKEVAKSADILTLSATPIPRTLNMSMSGIRDISILNDPPQNRYPVTTYVAEYDEGLVTDAVKREVARGGQVFYLHNHIDTIYKTADTVYKKTGLRVQIAHGKMTQEELSTIWEALLNREIDVLVCTTIIETGVDVPNCNTLIIDDADRLGLAQLHQIRGRVGRSDRRAYAYFLFRRGKTLSEDAYKRLMTIREYTEFGSGLKIAMRDLEIRGAGNVLGAEQSGHMVTVGYDLYMKLLSEAVCEEQGKEIHEDTCTVDLKVSAFIPDNYIRDTETRIEVYKMIAGIEDDDSYSDVLDEIIDRFGEPPKALMTLLEIAELRYLAVACGIVKIEQAQNGINLIMRSEPPTDAIADISSRYRRRVFYTPGQKPYFTFKTASIMSETKEFLKNYAECIDKKPKK